MVKITKVYAREILDSRGYPTIETTVYLSSGQTGTASVPSGVASGKDEAVELRDNDPKRFRGLGVTQAVNLINREIAPKLIGFDPCQQTQLDQNLIDWDGTPNKAKYGANSILSISMAVVKAAAAYFNRPVYQYLQEKYFPGLKSKQLPNPIFNVINGGKHGAGNLDFQEFQLIPSARFSFRQALQIGEEVYQSLKETLKYHRAIHSVGDEGGFAPDLFTNMDALAIILEAFKATPYQLAKEVFLGLDVAADFFYQNGHYEIKDRSQPYSEDELISYYSELVKEYRLFSLEDGLHSGAFSGWSKLNNALGNQCLIVGDDLLSTNKNRVKEAVNKKACNAILVKPNQVGTITETVSLVSYCRQQGWKIIVSHRSGETNDSFIADFAVGVRADFTKFGAPARGERIAKYNRLLAIADELSL